MSKQFYKTRFTRHIITVICKLQKKHPNFLFQIFNSSVSSVTIVSGETCLDTFQEKKADQKEQPQTNKRQSQLKACD